MNSSYSSSSFFTKLKTLALSDKIAIFFATGAGSGFLPWAPGTWGSLMAAVFIYPLLNLPVEVQILFWIIFFAMGVWSAQRFDLIYQTKDNSRIVIDEILGMGIATVLVQSIPEMILAFVLFRVFDILKPLPIRWIDRLSKNRSSLTGFFVILDDLIAGLFALLAFGGISHLS